MERIDPKDNPYLRVLFYGDPGSTKTRTSSTAVFDDRTYPTLMLGAANNPLAIRDYKKLPDIIKLETVKDLNDPYDWLQRGQPKDDPLVKAMDLHPPYKCVIIDGITEIQRFSFNAQTGAVKLGPGDFPEKATYNHFGMVLGQMIQMARYYLDLPMHVILTSLEKQDKDEVTGLIKYAPLLWGQSDKEVGGYAYVVGRLMHLSMMADRSQKLMELADATTTSVALFKPSAKYVAKDQYGVLGDFMVNPSIPKILELVFGGHETKS